MADPKADNPVRITAAFWTIGIAVTVSAVVLAVVNRWVEPFMLILLVVAWLTPTARCEPTPRPANVSDSHMR